MAHFEHLFSPIKIGPMQISNRIMMPGMSAGMMLDSEARVTPEMIAYYVERARTCPGMMAVGSAAVVPSTTPKRHPLAIDTDDCLPTLKSLVDAVHQYDTKFGIQLWDGGTQTGGKLQLSPSGVAANAQAVFDLSRETPLPKVLSIEDIKDVVGYFADAAVRCQKAGFDFVEIHAGHGYLISAFLSPYFNKRTDIYGVSLENRSRFLIEILRAVKAAVGPRTGVGIKMNGDDFMPDEAGWTLKDTLQIAPVLEAEGADYLTITAGVMGATRLTVPPMYEKQGCFADMATAVKKLVSIPVGTVGRIKTPTMANDLIASGEVDFVCMGRPLIADSQFVDKARRGDLQDIRLCLADCRGCIDQEMRSIKQGAPGSASCVVNPRMQRESVCIDVEGDKRETPKTILVAGAGLAGLEAARRGAFSGHRVILCESRAFVGGQIRFASMIPGRKEIGDMLPWYERQIAKYGVDLRLNTNVDTALLDEIAPDVVIIATGSLPAVPQNMMELVYEAGNINVMLIDDLLEQRLQPGTGILVIGGDQIGMQAADYLSEGGGRRVYVAEAHNHFAQKLAANDRWYLTARLIDKGVRRFKNVHDIKVTGDGTIRLTTDKGDQVLEQIDTIVFASERHPQRALAEIAIAKGFKTHLIGDSHDATSEEGGMILSSITQAYDVARAI
jgi:2,4-dienoyl-CoA reductase-like NADH-dependent reductase (Old Yellow Enzyme family)/thioredoxin reductase